MTQRVVWDAVRSVVVFRALNLGDMLCAVPALQALRHRLPHAHITLVGLAAAKPVLRFFPNLVDELVEFPGDDAFPEKEVDTHALPGFYHSMRKRRFDVAIQLHGSGGRSNAIVQKMEPAQWVGFVPDAQAAEPGRLMPWLDDLHEVHRYLALLEYIGIPAHDDRYELGVGPEDEAQARALAAESGLMLERLVIVHPGARLRSRRWPVERFAAVASALADDGWHVALTGSSAELELVQAVQRAANKPMVNLCGATDLDSLAAMVKLARLLVCNDTGISHVAAGVGTPSVVIASGSDVRRWAPLDKDRHRVLHAALPCRPCAYEVCPIGHPCALGVSVSEVLAAAREYLLEQLTGEEDVESTQ